MTKSSQDNSSSAQLSHLSLGKSVSYIDQYSPDLLQAVPRTLNRIPMGLSEQNLPFTGSDLWTGYEVSWLNPKGKPQIAIMACEVPIDSPNLIESKSFKLYLNSFNQSHFSDFEEVQATMVSDLSKCAGSQVSLKLLKSLDFHHLAIQELPGDCIDDLDISVDSYTPNPNLLSVEDDVVDETVVSHLLKSNCLITQQPDWASLQIHYIGNKICTKSLLRYIVSFRQHNEFHEQCVERIFCDILQHCKPQKLSVYARYTRRGGLDINPFRSNFETLSWYNRSARQ